MLFESKSNIYFPLGVAIKHLEKVHNII